MRFIVIWSHTNPGLATREPSYWQNCFKTYSFHANQKGGFLLVSFWLFWELLGSLWASFGRLWTPLARPWASFGSLWGALGPHWQFNRKLDVLYREMCQIHETVFKSQLFGICIAVPRVPLKWCHEVLLGPSLPHAPGVRMTWVSQTPSNMHLYYYYTCCICF